jgi:hypothetical protein
MTTGGARFGGGRFAAAELGFLVACLRALRAGPENAATPSPPTSEVNASALLRLAKTHGVLPLLANQPDGAFIRQLVEVQREEVRRYAQSLRLRNLFLVGQLREILRLMGHQGIPVIPLKGPVLAHQLYGRFDARQFGDLDLLLRPADLPRAAAILERRGLERESHVEGVRSYAGCKGQVRVELHWLLHPPYFGRANHTPLVWTRATPRPFCGTELLVLSEADQLLFLCMHGSKHGWERLDWIHDIAALLDGVARWDWDDVQRTAAHTGTSNALHVGLALSTLLLEAELPAEVQLPVLRSRAASRLVPMALRNLDTTGTRQLLDRELHGFRLQVAQSLGDRSRYLGHVAHDVTEVGRWVLGSLHRRARRLGRRHPAEAFTS